jgi:flagellar basal body rod protein FlgB
MTTAIDAIEQGLGISRYRAALLAADAACASTPGFRALDVRTRPVESEQGMRFAAALQVAPPGGKSAQLEFDTVTEPWRR